MATQSADTSRDVERRLTQRAQLNVRYDLGGSLASGGSDPRCPLHTARR